MQWPWKSRPLKNSAARAEAGGLIRAAAVRWVRLRKPDECNGAAPAAVSAIEPEQQIVTIMWQTTVRSNGDAAVTLTRLRRVLIAVFAVSSAGTALELLLLGHVEGAAQLVPVGLLILGVVVALWHALSCAPTARYAFQGLMAAFVLSGVVGMGLHYQGNAEFELEMYPELSGMELFRETVTGATPVLAPGTMCLLGIIGLAAAYRQR